MNIYNKNVLVRALPTVAPTGFQSTNKFDTKWSCWNIKSKTGLNIHGPPSNSCHCGHRQKHQKLTRNYYSDWWMVTGILVFYNMECDLPADFHFFDSLNVLRKWRKTFSFDNAFT